MRVLDRPTPPIALHSDEELDRWPIRPVVGIAGLRAVAEWDDPSLEWDDSSVPELEWDEDLVPGFIDATCDSNGISIDSGNPDEHFDFDAGRAEIQLDNSSGRWSRYTVAGTQAVHGPGYEIALWARYRDGGGEAWLFRGTISRWDEQGDVVIVEAFDSMSDLALPIGTYLPGSNGQLPGARLEAISIIAGRSSMARRFAAGQVTLTAQSTDSAPLEEMQAVASSDGAALFVDADGVLVSLNRSWRNGRTDQTVFPVISDNVCTVPIVVWDALLSANDSGQAGTVIFENVAHLRAQSPTGVITGLAFTETDHQWTTQVEGDTLAALVQGLQSDPRMNLDEFDLYLFDDQPDIFRAVEWRLLDALRFVHDQRAIDGINRLDINALVTAISHNITPDQWLMSVRTVKAMSPNQVLTWNPAGDPYWWDASGAVWGF